MIRIDGSYGEGGGQIVRYGTALAVLTQTPIEIVNIRAHRPKSGLQPQHLAAVSLLTRLCHAKTTGVTLGSSKITFVPGSVEPGTYAFDVGTAGSITLVFQACILACLHTTQPITIRLIGGTDVPWSPSWDYFTEVFLQHLKTIGISLDAKLFRRGYYPIGRGEAEITLYPIQKLKAYQPCSEHQITSISGNIHSAQLPDHIGTRMKHMLLRLSLKDSLHASITIEKTIAASPGTGITLWTRNEQQRILGASVLGEKKVPAEKVAAQVYTDIIGEIHAGATVDVHAFDQLIPYFVITEKPSYGLIRTMTSHAQTMIWLIHHFFHPSISCEQQKKNVKFLIQ
ncbi:MAG: RNA 3'-terminal phosphate cyclase [Candidatus Thermoplasmatota archaeon]